MSVKPDNRCLSKDNEEIIKNTNKNIINTEKEGDNYKNADGTSECPIVLNLPLSETDMNKKKIHPNRCYMCNVKLNIVDISVGKCKCDLMFCNKHKFPKMHQCTFDYRSVNAKILTNNIPIVKSNKLSDRI